MIQTLSIWRRTVSVDTVTYWQRQLEERSHWNLTLAKWFTLSSSFKSCLLNCFWGISLYWVLMFVFSQTLKLFYIMHSAKWCKSSLSQSNMVPKIVFALGGLLVILDYLFAIVIKFNFESLWLRHTHWMEICQFISRQYITLPYPFFHTVSQSNPETLVSLAHLSLILNKTYRSHHCRRSSPKRFNQLIFHRGRFDFFRIHPKFLSIPKLIVE